MGLGGDHDRPPLGGGGAGDPLTGAHAGALRHFLHTRSVRGTEDELVALFVVEVDETRVGAEDVRNLACDEPEHLLEIERRVDRRNRLGEEAQMALSDVHQRDSGRRAGGSAECGPLAAGQVPGEPGDRQRVHPVQDAEPRSGVTCRRQEDLNDEQTEDEPAPP